MMIDFDYLGRGMELKSVSTVNYYINSVNTWRRQFCRSEMIAGGVYTSMHYFVGDFHESYIYCKRLYQLPKIYNILFDNCLQNAAYALSLGTCTGEYAVEYQNEILILTTMTVPRDADLALSIFENTIEVYSSLSW